MEWFGDIEPHLGPHQVEDLIEAPELATTQEIRANWKIIVENYIDVYHLSHLHSNTLHMYDHARAQFGFVGPHFAFCEPLADWYEKDVEKHAAMPLLDEIPRDALHTWVPMLFPGMGLGENETSWSTFRIIPLAPDRTRVETRTKVKNASSWAFIKQSMSSSMFWMRNVSGKYADGEKGDPMTSGDFMQEDVFACEQQQKSLQSPYFETGPAAVHGERPVLGHQKVILRFLGEDV